MKYTNPIITGFYPDPSICKANGKYYMVCSSFQYFPGVPLFESEDLVNWTQIGNVLTRESQLPLKGQSHTGGIYAPTIRYNDGRFYMVTTNVGHMGNFYVWTDDIHGEWSEPVPVEQGGIDPSLYFEAGKAYFMSNGDDDEGESGITQCEIDIETGKKKTPSKCVYKGNGGRYIESPHLYKFGDEYYIMVAEGGTEYGHMVVYAKGPSINGPFENYSANPVLTNRNLGGYILQGCGHADLIEDNSGNIWMVHLAFRQIDKWLPFHITGREVCLVPVTFNEDGWFEAGVNGIAPLEIETDRISSNVVQSYKLEESFENTSLGCEWVYLRNPNLSDYEWRVNEGKNGQKISRLRMRPGAVTLDDKDGSPSFLAIRQRQMNGMVSCNVNADDCEAGITLYMNEEHHYDLAVRKALSGYEVVKRSAIGGVICEQNIVNIGEKGEALLEISMSNCEYRFYCRCGEATYDLGRLDTRYLSSEVACGFTGVMIGLYACRGVRAGAVDAAGDVELSGSAKNPKALNVAEFAEFKIKYEL